MISEEELIRRGVASITIRDALDPIIQEMLKRMLHKLITCAPTLEQLLEVRGEAKVLVNITEHLDSNIRAYDIVHRE